MSKFNVTFVPQLNRKPEIVEADDLCAVSDYTVQFVDPSGHTTLVLGGVERVEKVTPETAPFAFATTDTTGQPAIVPRGTLDEPTSGHPCQCSEATVQEDAPDQAQSRRDSPLGGIFVDTFLHQA